jgi:hypothetical protein
MPIAIVATVTPTTRSTDGRSGMDISYRQVKGRGVGAGARPAMTALLARVGLGVVVALVDVLLEVCDDGAAHGARLGPGLGPARVPRPPLSRPGAPGAPLVGRAVSIVISSSRRASPLVCHAGDSTRECPGVEWRFSPVASPVGTEGGTDARDGANPAQMLPPVDGLARPDVSYFGNLIGETAGPGPELRVVAPSVRY